MKRNVYEQEAEQEELTDESLADMVSKKHAGNTDTDIICKNFLEALENNKYGRTVLPGLMLQRKRVDGIWKAVKKRERDRNRERKRQRKKA